MRPHAATPPLLRAGGCLFALLALTGCGESAPAAVESPARAAPPAVEEILQAARAELQPWPATVRTQGSLIEDEYATIGAKVAGRIKQVSVDLGDMVEQGATIAALELEDFELRVQQAEAQVAQARAALGLRSDQPDSQLDPLKAPPVLQERAMLDEAQFNIDRRRPLVGSGVVTTQELQQLEAALRVAQARYQSAVNSVQEQIALLKVRRAELALAEQLRADAVFKAPFTGAIQECQVAPGSYVNIGSPVATLVRTDPLRFRAGVPELSSQRVRVGQTIRILLDGGAAPLEAKISRISPALDLTSRSLIIEADVANPDGRLRTGLFAEAEIIVGPDDRALLIPRDSIVNFAGLEKVWVVVEGRASARRIRTGRQDGAWVEVLEGLEAGETILSDGQRGREGVVRIQTGTPLAENR